MVCVLQHCSRYKLIMHHVTFQLVILKTKVHDYIFVIKETSPPPASDQGSSQLSEGRVEIFSLEIQNINFITLEYANSQFHCSISVGLPLL